MAVAYCWAGGLIEMSETGDIPKGALPVYTASSMAQVRARVQTRARHAYAPDTYLVPGVPEAENKMAAVDALVAFREFIAK